RYPDINPVRQCRLYASYDLAFAPTMTDFTTNSRMLNRHARDPLAFRHCFHIRELGWLRYARRRHLRRRDRVPVPLRQVTSSFDVVKRSRGGLSEACLRTSDVTSKVHDQQIQNDASGSLYGIGYFEGPVSERGIAWRAADSLAVREFVGLGGWTGERRITRRSRGRAG